MKSEPGTYALILESYSTARIQVGRWREIDVQPGYYLYVGSAFGPGGVRARVSRHLRVDKRKHWHIDYLREFLTPLALWVSYAAERLEHQWVKVLYEKNEPNPILGFGCSDCKCDSHLFYINVTPDVLWLSTSTICSVSLYDFFI